MSSAVVTLQGRLTADPELRYTQSGLPVANLTIAHNPRSLDRATNEWTDSGDPLFVACTVWRDQAENIAASLHKGDHVVAIGRLKSRQYTVEGEARPRTVTECEIDVLSVDLRRQRATVARVIADAAAASTDEPWSVPGDADAAQSARRRASA